jgi:hypothetical protein
MSSPLTQFGNLLVRFFEELGETFPEERDIKLALDTIQSARKINPRLISDLFYEHIAKDLREPIAEENEVKIIQYAKTKISTQFNEILPALSIFDKHWATLSDQNRTQIWKYLKALVILNDRARTVRV